MTETFSFEIPEGDSADFALSLVDAPDLTGWALTFTAGTVVKTSALGQVVAGTPVGGVTIHVVAGDFPMAGVISASLVASYLTQQLTWYGYVVVMAAAPNGDLTTLAKVRTYIFGADAPYDADAILSGLITSSSAWVVSRLGQRVLSRTVTETRSGNGTSRMLLRQFPASAVTSVTVDGVSVPARTTVGDSGYVLNGDAIELTGYSFTAGSANVEIVYSAGSAVCPSDLEQATVEHVALRYRDRTRSGIGSQSSGGESATFSDAGALAYIEGVLAASNLNTHGIA